MVSADPFLQSYIIYSVDLLGARFDGQSVPNTSKITFQNWREGRWTLPPMESSGPFDLYSKCSLYLFPAPLYCRGLSTCLTFYTLGSHTGALGPIVLYKL